MKENSLFFESPKRINFYENLDYKILKCELEETTYVVKQLSNKGEDNYWVLEDGLTVNKNPKILK